MSCVNPLGGSLLMASCVSLVHVCMSIVLVCVLAQRVCVRPSSPSLPSTSFPPPFPPPPSLLLPSLPFTFFPLSSLLHFPSVPMHAARRGQSPARDDTRTWRACVCTRLGVVDEKRWHLVDNFVGDASERDTVLQADRRDQI